LQGQPQAQFNLAVAYSSGQIAAKDAVQAYMWADLAASAAETRAAGLRDSLRKTTTPDQIAEGQRRSREWKPEKR
jgi:TPR repeat protein